MYKKKDKSNPILYVFFLGLAVFMVYRAFSLGFDKGDFRGRYDPPEEAHRMVEEKKVVDLRKLRLATPELVSLGKEVFTLNCASCHGAGGDGDGPKAAGLSPPPRNFTTEQFKFGASALQLYKTISQGSPGTSMAAFDFLSEEERFAVIHYVRTRVPNPPDDPQELVDALPLVDTDKDAAVPSSDSAGAATGQVQSAELPVEFAAERLLAEGGRNGLNERPGLVFLERTSAFGRHCAQCHGLSGEGRVLERQFPAVGTLYIRTDPISAADPRGEILKSQDSFREFISSASPGLPDHSFAELSAREIEEIFNSLEALAGNNSPVQ